jgi:FMN phosphatase YigB (HAD superfamily)
MPGNNRFSNIIENDEIRGFLSIISYDTSVIIFDLDNTVGWPGTYLGSDQWFMRLFEYLGHALTDKSEITNLAVALYYEVQRQSKMQAVEDKVILLIRCLQSIGYPVIALTSRGQDIAEATSRQLASIGLNFDDIIFCDGKPKGNVLKNWISLKKPDWQKAVMIDDKEKHLCCVSDALSPLGISFKGLRYSRMDTFFAKDDNCNQVHQSLMQFTYFSEPVKRSLMPILDSYQPHSP